MALDPEISWVCKRIVQVDGVFLHFLYKKLLCECVKIPLFFLHRCGRNRSGGSAAGKKSRGRKQQDKETGNNSFFEILYQGKRLPDGIC